MGRAEVSWLRNFPLRKFIGFICGCLTALFAILFLGKALATGLAVPDGVVTLLGILGGVFGGYVGSSSAEAIAERRNYHEGE